MKRIPVLATIIVAAAVATMIGLGIWQLQRAQEKDRLLAEYARAAALPPLDLDPLLARANAEPPQLAFRRMRVSCRIRDAAPELRGGRSRRGEGGYVHLLPCRPGAQGLAGRLVVNAGWARLPDADRRFTLDDGIVAGTLGAVRDDGPVVLIAAEAPPPLEPAAPPRLEDIADNHLAYAFQWFFFAAAAAVIYVLALRRRQAEKLSTRPGGPKSPAP